MIGFADLRAASAAIKSGVASILGREARPLVIGGCCSLLPGAIAGARETVGPTALAFVNGHLDFYDGNTSDTGEAADMDLAILAGWGPTGVVDSGDGEPLVEPADVVVVGYRDEDETARFGAVDPAAVAPEMLLVHARDVLANGSASTGEVATRGWKAERSRSGSTSISTCSTRRSSRLLPTRETRASRGTTCSLSPARSSPRHGLSVSAWRTSTQTATPVGCMLAGQ